MKNSVATAFKTNCKQPLEAVLQVEQGVGFLFLLERGDDGVQSAFEDVGKAV